MSENAKWYVIHTYSGYENKVAQTILKVVDNRNLHDLIQEVKIPTEIVKEISASNKECEVERKIFPGYVLVKMILTDDTRYVVRNTRGVTGFLGTTGANTNPIPLSDKEVAAMGIETDAPQSAKIEVSFKVGDRVRISSGMMNGMVGEVKNIDMEEMKVDIYISNFPGVSNVTLSISDVVLADEY